MVSMFCVALSMDLFVLCVVCLTGFVNCLVKQFAICLGVFAILLLKVMEQWGPDYYGLDPRDVLHLFKYTPHPNDLSPVNLWDKPIKTIRELIFLVPCNLDQQTRMVKRGIQQYHNIYVINLRIALNGSEFIRFI